MTRIARDAKNELRKGDQNFSDNGAKMGTDSWSICTFQSVRIYCIKFIRIYPFDARNELR